ncbi:MAG: hypothetical protein ACOC0P_05460, partial [Planctomycetota bacterium]
MLDDPPGTAIDFILLRFSHFCSSSPHDPRQQPVAEWHVAVVQQDNPWYGVHSTSIVAAPHRDQQQESLQCRAFSTTLKLIYAAPSARAW